jgi:hypothetical protein
MTSPDAAAWVCEWRVFSDRIEPRLRGKAAKNVIIRKFFTTKEDALAEQRLQRLAHSSNPNFVSSVTPWTPPPAKPPKRGKSGHKG